MPPWGESQSKDFARRPLGWPLGEQAPWPAAPFAGLAASFLCTKSPVRHGSKSSCRAESALQIDDGDVTHFSVNTPVDTEPADAPHALAAAFPTRTAARGLLSQGELLVAAVYFLVVIASLALTRGPSGFCLLWPANAIAAALMVRSPGLRWGRTLACLLGADILGELLGANDTLLASVAMSTIDTLEIGLTVYLFRRVIRLPFPNITFAAGVGMFALLAVGIPAVPAALGGVVASQVYGMPFPKAAASWFIAVTAGAVLCAPSIYLYSSKTLRRLLAPEVRASNIALAAGCLIVTYCSMRFARFPLLTLSIPLIVIAFRVGAFGAAVICEMVGLLVVLLWGLNLRAPGPLVPITAGGLLADMPFLALAAIMISPIVMGFAADDRDRAMRALRFNEQRFRQSLRHSPTGIVMRGLDGSIHMANDAFLKMVGYDWPTLNSMSAEQLVHPDDHKASKRDMETLLNGTTDSYVAERRYRHSNGSWIWVRVAVSVVDGDDGAPMHFIGHVESLEANRRADRDLAEERERLRTTLRAIGDAVITTDALGQITYVNAAAEKLIGQRLEEIAGRRLDEVVVLTNPQTTKTLTSMFALCLARGEPAQRSERCLLHRPDGRFCYVIDAASPVNDSDGAVTGVVVVLHDATAGVERDRELNHRAAHDPLTGLANRFELDRRLSECFDRYRYMERPATLLLIDLDRFKAVNDSGGHGAGDEVLRRVAQALKAVVRDSDTVARIGGDEFAILLSHADPERTEAIGVKVLRAISDLVVPWNGASYTVGASIGAACLRPGMNTVAGWIAAADAACYDAKRAGRGQIRVAA